METHYIFGNNLFVDLVQYKKHIDRGVTSAAKGLLSFYRQEAPMLLAKKDRGKPTESTRQLVLAQYGEAKIKTFIDGAHILPVENEEECQEEMPGTSRTGPSWEQDGEWQDVQMTPEENLDEDDVKVYRYFCEYTPHVLFKLFLLFKFG